MMNCNRKCMFIAKEETPCLYEGGPCFAQTKAPDSDSFEKDYGVEARVIHPGSGFVAGMIDGYDGAQRFELTLLKLMGGAELSFKITYDSSQTREGVLGIGWSHCFEKSLVIDRDTAYLYERPGVYRKYHRWESDEMFWGRTMGCLGDQLYETKDGYRLERDFKQTEYYSSKGQMAGIKMRNGREVRILHYKNQIIVTDMLTMKSIYLDLDDAGKMIRVYDTNERTVEFTYADGRLAEICDVNGNHRFYTYDENGRMVSEWNDEGICLYQNTYDEEGRIVCREDGKKQAIHLHYNDEQRIITDRNGNQYQWTFNQHGLPASKKDANGNTCSYTYNVNGKPETIIDANGNKRTVEYLGYGKPRWLTDQKGQRTEFSYERERISKITYPDGMSEWFSYNSQHLLAKHRDLRGTVTTFTYDKDKNLISKKIGNKKNLHYDYENGLLISKTDAKGYTTRYRYNDLGQRIATIDAAGRETLYEYDLSGKLLKVTDPLGGSKTYTYNCNDQLCSATDENGNITTYIYNDNRKPEKIVFADDTVILLEYDAEDQLIGKVDREGNATLYGYDPAGRLISVQLPDGKVVEYSYDAVGNLVKEAYSDGMEITYTYDVLGNRLTTTDSQGNQMRYQYDCRSRIIREVNPFGGATLYQYSPAGDLLSERDPLGHQTVYTYDAYGNRMSVCDPRGNVTRYIYDSNDHLVAMTDPLGNSTYYEYNNCNQLIGRTNPKNQKEQYRYDAAGRLVGYTDAKENWMYLYYDAVGNLKTLCDRKNNERFKITYDSMNRPVSILDVFDHETMDLLGSPQEPFEDGTKGFEKEKNGKVFYDLAGRVVAYEKDDDMVHITYDENGNLHTVADQNGISYREYDALNRLVSYTASDGKTIGYRYDPTGNLTAIIYPDQTEVLYSYDANHNLVSVTDWAGRSTWYLYDANDQVIGVTKTNGQVLTMIYDEAGQLISQVEGFAGGETLSSVEYEYDALGRIQSEKERIKNQRKVYTYDEQAKVVSVATYDIRGALCAERSCRYDECSNMVGRNFREGFSYDPKRPERLPLTRTNNGKETKFVYGLGLIGFETDGDFNFFDTTEQEEKR